MKNDIVTYRYKTYKMKPRETLQAVYHKVDNKFCQQFGFKIKDATFNKIVVYMHAPKDSSSLAVTRILFGKSVKRDFKGKCAILRYC